MASTALDLVNLALRRAGNVKQIASLTSLTDEALFMMRAIDLSHKDLCGMAHWDWLRTTGIVQLYPVLTATATTSTTGWSSLSSISPSGSTVIYSGSTDPTSPYVGGWFRSASGLGDACRITAVTSATAGTVSNYFGTTGSSQSVTIAQDAFALPQDFDKPLNTNSYVTAPWSMRGVDPEEFFRAREYNSSRRSSFLASGKPEIYTLWADNYATTTKRMALLVDPFPAAGETVTLHYYRKGTDLTSDSAYPDLPGKWHNYLIHCALEQWHLFRDVNLTKAGGQAALKQRMLAQMLVGVERTTDRSAMSPATDQGFYQGQ